MGRSELSRLTFPLALLLSIVSITGILGEVVLPRTNSVNTSQLDNLVWRYILDKYSTSGEYLTSEDVKKLVNNVRKKCDGDGAQKSDSANSCMGIPLLESDKQFDNFTSLNDVCHKILFFVDNPTCCDAQLFTRQPPTVQDDQGTNNVSNKGDLVHQGQPYFLSLEPKLKSKEKPTSGEVWGYGILCVTLISMCSLAGVSVMPFMKKEFYKSLLTALVGLAVGSLIGSAVFHLIPQAYGLADHDPNHEYLFISLVLCGGIWLFFMVERILKFIMDYKDRKAENWNREKIPSIVSSTPENSTISMLVENGNCIKSSPNEGRHSLSSACSHREPGVIYECQEQAIKASFGHQERPRLSSFHDHSVKFEQGKDSVIATVAYMIIFGDGLHNFIDGLSIGAAFNESILTGVSISVAVLCEELPHELGDFAVLLNAGMSIRQALTYNFLSACTCYIGMAVGIFLGEVEASSYIFALASGMFLYISLTDMLPEMNEIAVETSKVSIKKGMHVLLLQNIGLFTGITTLFLLAKYQDSIQF